MIRDETSSLEEQHKLCPKHHDSWCKFWKDRVNKTNTYDNQKRLSDVFLQELKAIFVRLSKDDLLARCLKGLTQNQNESMNGQLWSRCPKNRFCGKRRVVIAVCETVGVFNTGAASKAVLMQQCGVSPGRNMLKALRQEDQERVNAAARKVSSKYRQQRQSLRSKRKSRADKVSYQPGAFGISAKPEIKSKSSKTTRKSAANSAVRDGPSVASSSTSVEVTFVMPDWEVVYAPPMQKD